MEDINSVLFQEAITHFPGGVSSPARAFHAVGGTPKFFRRARGARFEDEAGRRYVDLCMSWGALILGHAIPEVINAVKEAMEEGLTFGAPSRREIALARKIKLLAPFVEKMRFVPSGTEAVMSAMRTARGFTRRERILKFDGCYHGHCDSLLIKSSPGVVTGHELSSDGIPSRLNDLTIVISLDDHESMEQVFTKYGYEIAAAIIEPIPANYGLLLQDKSFLTRLRELCLQYGTVLIFDEVISGFRVAPGGAAELFGIVPDLVVYGQIIGGGMPIGLYGGRKDIMSIVSPDGPVYQASTLSGNPITMAAGLATLEKLTPNTYRDLEKKSSLWTAAFSEIPGLQTSCIASMIWPKFQHDIKRADQVEGSAIAKFNRMHGLMLSQGIYLPPSGLGVAFISMAHDAEELAHFKHAISIIKGQLSV